MEPRYFSRSTGLRSNRLPLTRALAAILCISPLASAAASYQVHVDTSGFDQAAGYLVFDFFDGDWTANNRVTISQFSSDGALGTAELLGASTGSLLQPGSVVLADHDLANGFSELVQQIRFGTTLSFVLDLTEESPAPSGFRADCFAFFLLDKTQASLFETSDWSGADALFAVDIDGSPSGAVSNFAPADSSLRVSWTVAPASVPLPAAAWLFGSALLGGFAMGRRKPSTSRNLRASSADSVAQRARLNQAGGNALGDPSDSALDPHAPRLHRSRLT